MTNEKDIIELYEYKQRLELTLIGTNTGTFHHDFSKDINYYDERAKILLGITESSLSFEKWLESIHPDDRSVSTIILKGFEDMAPHINITYRVLKDGGIRHLKVDSFVQYKNGKPFYSYGLIQDITEIKEKEEELIATTKKLQTALDEIKTLKGIIPICSYCHKIRDDKGSWKLLEEYISNHSYAEFSHGICPKCYEEEMKKLE
jgi:PAS domain S-box-containing protein